MTARNGRNQEIKRGITEYIKEEYNELERIPTGGFFLESELSRSIGDDGQISDIKMTRPQNPSMGYLEF